MKTASILAILALTYASSVFGQTTPVLMPKTAGTPCLPAEANLFACSNDDFLQCDPASSTWIVQNKCLQICSYDVAYSQFCTYFAPAPMVVPGAASVVGVSVPSQDTRTAGSAARPVVAAAVPQTQTAPAVAAVPQTGGAWIPQAPAASAWQAAPAQPAVAAPVAAAPRPAAVAAAARPAAAVPAAAPAVAPRPAA